MPLPDLARMRTGRRAVHGRGAGRPGLSGEGVDTPGAWMGVIVAGQSVEKSFGANIVRRATVPG